MPAKILVVENNPVTRKMVRVTLETEGYQVLEAPDATTALALAASDRPNLILQDLALPDSSGFELVSRLRQVPGVVDTPILAFTGFLSRILESRLAGSGFNGLLVKPVEPSRLLMAVLPFLGDAGAARPSVAAAKRTQERKPRVLLVDDDPVQLKLQRVRLMQEGYDVETAVDGEEGLARARSHPPDVILSDVLMPRKDGYQLCLAVRQDPKLAPVPVVLTSAYYAEAADRELALRAGASGLVLRTPDLKEALKAVAAALKAEAPPVVGEGFVPLHQIYVERIVRQLERQVEINSGLAQRAGLLGASLSILGTISKTLTEVGDVTGSLEEVLTYCIDAAGLSRAAIYFREPDGRWHCVTQLGFPLDARDGVATCFDNLALLEGAARDRVPITVTASTNQRDPRNRLLMRAGASVAILAPLISGGASVGVLLFTSADRDLATPEWRAFAQTIGAAAGQALGLRRAFDQLRDDLTRIQAADKQIRWLTHAVDEGPASIIMTDTNGRIEYVNRKFETVSGYTADEVMGKTPSVLKSGVTPLEVYGSLWSTLAAGREWRGELQNRKKNGELYWDRASISPIRDSEGRITHYLAVQEDVTEYKRAEAALRASETRFSQLAENISEVFFVVEAQFRETVYISPAYETIWGRTCRSAYEQPRSFLDPVLREDLDGLLGNIAQVQQGRDPGEAEFRITQPGGKVRWIRSQAVPVRNEQGAVYRIAGVALDITERKLLEEQFRQAQKMEAVGRLAGGVAHDFNNLLTAITGYATLLREDLPPGDQRGDDLDEILQAANRAAGLTRQLLAFSRRQVVRLRVLDLNEVVTGMDKMLRRIIGEDVELRTGLAPSLGGVSGDPGQIEQVIVNLSVNARDAMTEGGTLTIETGAVELDASYAATHPEVRPGPYVMLAVSDTGTGMSAETQGRIFEPFFTTKEPGKGTGLGLATVYGIVKQSEGHVSVYSELGRGTTFKVYFPVVAPKGETVLAAPETASRGGNETVLLVEDEEGVRKLALAVLQRQGYAVLEAQNGAQALEVCRRHSGPVHLMVTDVVMPGVGGPEAAAQLQALRPDMKVLYMSGYTDRAMAHQRALGPDVAFLQKPFTPSALARNVREVLDQ